MSWATGWQFPEAYLEWVHEKIISVAHEPFGEITHEHDYHSAHALLSYQPSLFHEDPYWRDTVDAFGKEIDVIRATLDSILEGFFVAHAPEWALRRWEEFVDVSVAPGGVSDQDRRAAVLAKLVVGPKTVADFLALVESFFGLEGNIVEDFANYSVEFNVYGAPTAAEQEAFEKILRAYLPAHLALTVNYGGFIAGVSMAGDVV